MKTDSKLSRTFAGSKRSGWVLGIFLFVSINAFADSITIVNASKPLPALIASSKCENATLLLKGVNLKVEKVQWRYDNTIIGTSYTPALIQTVAGSAVEGIQDDEFRFPSSVAVDKDGNIYVADQFNHRVQKWTPGSKYGVTVAGGRGQGDAADQLDYPMGVTIDSENNLYVSDASNHRIQKFTPGNPYGVTVAGGNGRGNASHQLGFPAGICIDRNGNLYIADYYNHRIQKWAFGATTGTTVAGNSQAGNNADQLRYPTSVKVDKEGTLYIADAANDRIQAWYRDAKKGVTVAGGKGRGKQANQLYYPTDIAINDRGDLFVVDETNQRIQKWSKGAAAGITVAGDNGLGNGMNQFSFPHGLFIDAQENIYVADQYNHRIQLFRNPDALMDFEFTAERPGIYAADVIFRDGELQQLEPVEIKAAPVLAPINLNSNWCTGKEYQMLHEVKGGVWSSDNAQVMALTPDGLAKPLSTGKVMISYQVITGEGCKSKVNHEIMVNETPSLLPIRLEQSLLAQPENVSAGNNLCEGSDAALQKMPASGQWVVSDSSMVAIRDGRIYGLRAGVVAIRYTAATQGCEATSETIIKVGARPQPVVIHGMNKVVVGSTIQLSAGESNGRWSMIGDNTASIDAQGYVRGMVPGIVTVHYTTFNNEGCEALSSMSVLVQPKAPTVSDKQYQFQQHGATISIKEQVMEYAWSQLLFYTTANANASPVESAIKNQPGDYTYWVSLVVNGIASPKVPFKVAILDQNRNTVANGLEVKVFGNPVVQFFSVQVNSTQAQQPISMRVIDIYGRIIEQRQQIQLQSTIQFGHQYGAGQYFVEYVQGTNRKVIQLIKSGSQSAMGSAKSTIAIR